MGMLENKWRSIHHQDGLRRRYMTLLVPALAEVHANYPHGSSPQLQRAQAIRRAADTCLVQALSSPKPSPHHPHELLRPADHSCLHHGPSAAPRKIASASARRRSSSFTLQALIITRKAKLNGSGRLRLKAARSYKQVLRRAAGGRCTGYFPGCRAYYGITSKGRRRGAKYEGSEQQAIGGDVGRGIIPAESELRRLQCVMFPEKKRRISTESCSTAGGDGGGRDDQGVANPAALLGQAAHYIMSLQVQVEALRSLASLSVGSLPGTPTP